MTTAPVLDAEALSRLGEQLGDADMLRGFVRRYVSMLDQRLDRLEHALRLQDHEGWMDAVLSLRTSSELAGARALAAEATILQEEARTPRAAGSGTIRCRAGTIEHLRHLAEETARQLRAFLERPDTPAPRTP